MHSVRLESVSDPTDLAKQGNSLNDPDSGGDFEWSSRESAGHG